MERERNGFSIIGFIAQILVILLFIFVLMWLFPTKSYIENNNNGTNSNNNNNIVNSEILFNQNLLSMKDAAREYFTNSRMPKKAGESVTLTLEEMIEKNMVLELIDGNAKKCDVKTSYVKVTKVDDEYEMIVTLTCSGVTKTIKTTIGCYNYCTSDLCEKDDVAEVITQTLYQYKKTTDPISKWSDWSTWSKNKVTATSKREVQTKTENEKTGTKTEISEPTTLTIYSCPTDYTLSNDKQTCYKNTNSTDKIDSIKTTTYSCPTGYAMSADKKTCTKTTTTTLTVTSSVTQTYSCPTGYAISADKKTCTKKSTIYADKIAVYACKDSSYTLSTDKTKCIKTLTTQAIPHIDVSFSCVNGACQTITNIDYYYCSSNSYKLSGTTCKKTVTEDSVISSYKCPTGYTMNTAGTTCYKSTINETLPTVKNNYSCPTGYTISTNKKTCTKPVTTTLTVASTVKNNYLCPSNDYTLSSDKQTCSKITTSTLTTKPSVKYNYSCLVGNLNKNNKCETTVDVYGEVIYYRYRTYETIPAKTYTKWSTSNNDKTLINQGYKYTGVTKEVTSK